MRPIEIQQQLFNYGTPFADWLSPITAVAQGVQLQHQI
jgi:hypothetical protein